MNQYFLSKTGWEFFDVSRAYGIGIIVHALSGDAVVSDMGGFYLIKSNKTIDFSRISKIQEYIGDDLDWPHLFISMNESEKRETRKFFTDEDNVRDILNTHSTLQTPSNISIKKNKNFPKTLYMPLELAATKGFREGVISSYYEGKQVYITKHDFYLSILGFLNSVIRKASKDTTIFVIPIPYQTRVLHLKTAIRGNVKDSVKSFHRAGWFVTLSHIAVNIVIEDLNNKQEKGKFSPTFSGLIYGVLAKPANMQKAKPKPKTGGIFPLDFLYQIAEFNEARDVLNRWKDIFERTAFRKGYEDLPTSLAEFIANPSLSNYEGYIRLHLRNELDKDRIKFGSYKKRVLKEVVSFVGV